MAADYAATATTVVSPPAYHGHAHKSSVHYKPVDSGNTTPVNASPTSPRSSTNLPSLHAPIRHIRPPKTALYVPAALRPTEKPQRSSPPKNTNTEPENDNISFNGIWQAGDNFENGISRIVSEQLDDDAFGPVTGPPSKNHWKMDNSTNVCSASACRQPFSFFVRRHHCRRCGGIFCGAHSSNSVRLNQLALFHPRGSPYRACDRCHSAYRQWEARRANRMSRTNSDSSDSTNGQPAQQIETAPATPIASAAPKRPDTFRVGSLASSVPSNWNWSTF